MRGAWPVVLLAALAAGGCGPDAPAPPPDGAPLDVAAVRDGLDRCLDGDADAGVARLDSVLDRSPGAPDALVARGLCRWARWDDAGDVDDVRLAYADLSAAIEAVEGGTPARGTPLDEIYSRRAFVAQALDGGWVRTIEDLDRAAALAPGEPRHVLDRGVVRSYAGDSVGARRDLRQYLALVDSFGTPDPSRQVVVERLLEDLGEE
ncbi:hypothetical protein [Rubrivirga sp.]|uniref:hypothetical protein n=1 Tax=Rubrivirga sp. TaxID=1885344 RepID=UPI003B52610A